MTYNKQFWVNDDPNTPLSAARLTHMETGIWEAHNLGDPAKILVETGPNFTKNLQDAINNPDKKNIVLPAGEHQLTDTINLDKASGKTIRGAGMDETVLKAAKNTGKHGFISTSNSGLAHVDLELFTLDMQWEEGDKQANGFQITNTVSPSFYKVRVRNGGAHGWLLQGHGAAGKGCVNPRIVDCEVLNVGLKKNQENQGASGHGIIIKDNTSGAVVSGCTIMGVSCGMGVSVTHTNLGAPKFFKIVDNHIVQGDNVEIGYEPIGCTKETSHGLVQNNTLPVSYDNGISVGSYTTVAGNTIGEAWNHGIAVSGPGTTVLNNAVSNIGKETFLRPSDPKKDWGVLTFENPNGCVALGNTYSKSSDQSEAAHMVKVNVTPGHDVSKLGGNIFVLNTGVVLKDSVLGANRNPNSKDVVSVGGPGKVDPEDIKQAIVEHFRQNPPAIDGLNTAIQREVQAALSMLLQEKKTAVEKWIEPNKRYYAPVTYWWADQRNQVSNWHHLFANLDAVPFVVVNPRSGPGEQVEEDFSDLATKIHASGKPTLGYVRTVQRFEQDDQPRQLRDKQTILDEIKKYVDWYHVKGAFIDEMVNGWSESQAGMIPFYKDLYEELKRLYGSEFLVVGNPGSNTKEEVLQCADILMTFEQNAEKYLQDEASPVYPDHYKKYPAERFWHVVHNVTDKAQLRKVLDKASKGGAAFVYATTDTFDGVQGTENQDNNPWDNLPQPWCIEMNLQWARKQDALWKATEKSDPNDESAKNQLVRTGDDGFIHCSSGPWDNPHLVNKSYSDWSVNTRADVLIRVVPHNWVDFKHDTGASLQSATHGTLYFIMPEEGDTPALKFVPNPANPLPVVEAG